MESQRKTGVREGFEEAQHRLFENTGLDARSRYLDLDSLGRTHVFEAGPENGTPVVFVHGTAQFGGFLSPLISEFTESRVIAFDRPGYGFSDPYTYTKRNLQRTMVTSIHGVLDELGVEEADLVGHSMGGHASILFTLEHPNRVNQLFLVGSVPGFPGTRPPLPIRVLTTPFLGGVLRRMQKQGEEGVLDIAEVFGERESIQNYPTLIRAIAHHEEIPESARAGLTEFRSLISSFGWRKQNRVAKEDLVDLQRPTTLVWGANDPLGKPGEVLGAVEQIPDSHFETLDTGHMPFLAHPGRCARIIRNSR